MKELSIEEKAKAYDEALAKAAKIHRNYKGRVRAVDVVIEEVFPELKESEDEKIRKCLIDYFSNFHLQTFAGINPKKIIAWIEKQDRLMKILQISNSEIAELVEEKYNLEEKLKKQGEQKP